MSDYATELLAMVEAATLEGCVGCFARESLARIKEDGDE